MSKTIGELRAAALALDLRLTRELDGFLKENGVPVGHVDVSMIGYQNMEQKSPSVIGHKVSVRLDTGL